MVVTEGSISESRLVGSLHRKHCRQSSWPTSIHSRQLVNLLTAEAGMPKVVSCSIFLQQ